MQTSDGKTEKTRKHTTNGSLQQSKLIKKCIPTEDMIPHEINLFFLYKCLTKQNKFKDPFSKSTHKKTPNDTNFRPNLQ